MGGLEELLAGELPESIRSKIEQALKHQKDTEAELLKLQAQNNLYDQLIENTSDAIWLMNPEHKIVYMSKPMERILGYTQQEIVDMPLSKRLTKQSLELVEKFFKDDDLLEQSGQANPDRQTTLEIWQTRKDGSLVPVEVSIKRLRDHNRNSIGYVGVTRDISDWVEKDNRLRESEARHRALFEDAPDAILILKKSPAGYTIAQGNSRAEEYFGVQNSALIGKTPAEFSPNTQPNGKPSSAVQAEKVRKALLGKKQKLTWMHQHINGKIIPTELQISRFSANGDTDLQVIMHDITKRTRLERIDKIVRRLLSETHSTNHEQAYNFIASSIAEALDAEHVIIGTLSTTANPDQDLSKSEIDAFEPNIASIASYHKGMFIANINYPLEGTPCKRTMTLDERIHLTRTNSRDEKIQFDITSTIIKKEYQKTHSKKSSYPKKVKHFKNVSEKFPSSKFLTTNRIKEYVGVPIVNEDGNVQGIIAAYSSKPMSFFEEEASFLEQLANIISSRMQDAEHKQKIIKADEQLSAALNASSDVIWTHDIKTGNTTCNDLYYKILGYEPNEIPIDYESLKKIVHPEDLDTFVGIIQRKIDEKDTTTYQFEYRAKAKDGSYKWLSEKGSIAKVDERGNPLIMAGVTRDITEQKKKDLEYQQAQRLETAGILATGIAHDFNNYLAGIRTGLEILLETEFNPTTKTRLKSMINRTDRAANMTRQLLAIGRQKQKTIESVPVRKIINDISNLLGTTTISTATRIINLSTQISEDAYDIDGDSTQIEQAINNLVINASEAMPNGGNITINAYNTTVTPAQAEKHLKRIAGDYLVIEVNDTGTGMDDNTKEKIFNPFFTTKKTGPKLGTGLGLSNTNDTVKEHGGFIEVESELGKGTSFKLYFPRGQQKSTATSSRDIESTMGSETILVIDDDQFIRENLKLGLEKYGYKVLTANNGKEGLSVYKDCAGIDLVVLDLIMPVMGGPETYSRIKELNPRAKIILSTGNDRQEIPAHMLLDKVASLHKPYPIASLTRTIRDCIDAKNTSSTQNYTSQNNQPLDTTDQQSWD